MKSAILLLAVFTLAITSCTTAYKTGQTPDDVYYSPARPQAEKIWSEQTDDSQSRIEDEYYDDRYLRMKVRDRYRWSDLDDSYYYNRRYSYSTYDCSCFSNPWTPYSYWNNYYNPYYNNYTIINPKTTTTYNKPRTFNLNAYNSPAPATNNSNSKYKNSGNNSSNNNTYYEPRNTNSGSNLRDIFGGSNKNNSSSSGSSSNSSSSSSSSGSSSSGSSGSSAPVRKF